MTILAPGTTAPAFTLHATRDQSVALKEFRGRNVILAFYPADWSPVCNDQLALYNELLDEFARLNAQLLAISVDGACSHAALARERKFYFPLLSDFEPKGDVARAYGVYDEKDGAPGINALDALPSNNIRKTIDAPAIDAREAP